MAPTHRATASFDDNEDNANDDGDVSASFHTDLPQDRNEEFSLLSNMLSDLSFLLGREIHPSSLQLALKKQQQRCGEMGEVLRALTRLCICEVIAVGVLDNA